MLRAFIVWVTVTLLIGTVAACPMMNCPMMQVASDDCCSSTSHPSHCPQHQNSNDCPYQVVEKAIASKISSNTVGVAVVDRSASVSSVLLEVPATIPVHHFPVDGSDLHLRLCTLLI